MVDKSTPIESKSQLVDYIASGSKPRDEWTIGTEHEKFCYHLDDLRPLSYDEPGGIRDLLEGLAECGWQKVSEADNLIALSKDGASITLEPGGQLELSGKMLKSIHETCTEVNDHLKHAKLVGDKLGVGFLGMGFHPFLKQQDVPRMPKGRYKIMRDYMPKVGTMGLDMMHRTCTVQVNLDFSDEADMVKKFRVALALQPVATALFANSPLKEAMDSGFKSIRSFVWTDTDKDRTGMLPFVFEDGFGFERWVDYLLDVPMYFVYRDKYIDAAGQSFRDFMNGSLPAYSGQLPRMADWLDHQTTVFPEVRLKTFLEMRGADGGPWSRLCALPAFWVGLLYDQSSLDAASDLIKRWTIEDMQLMRDGVPKSALRTPWKDGTIRDLAAEVLDIADAGLKSRAVLNGAGEDERGFLNALKASIASGDSPADEVLAAYKGRLIGDMQKLFAEYSY